MKRLMNIPLEKLKYLPSLDPSPRFEEVSRSLLLDGRGGVLTLGIDEGFKIIGVQDPMETKEAALSRLKKLIPLEQMSHIKSSIEYVNGKPLLRFVFETGGVSKLTELEPTHEDMVTVKAPITEEITLSDTIVPETHVFESDTKKKEVTKNVSKRKKKDVEPIIEEVLIPAIEEVSDTKEEAETSLEDIKEEPSPMKEKRTANTERVIVSLIREDPNITQPELAKLLKVSLRTVKRIIKGSDRIRRVGSNYNGHWEILEKEEN